MQLIQHRVGLAQQCLQMMFCPYVRGQGSDRYLTRAAKKQTGHSFLDVSMAKDVGSNLCKDALMQIWLRSKRLELCLLLHPTRRAFHIRCSTWLLANCSKPGYMQLATCRLIVDALEPAVHVQQSMQLTSI